MKNPKTNINNISAQRLQELILRCVNGNNVLAGNILQHIDVLYDEYSPYSNTTDYSKEFIDALNKTGIDIRLLSTIVSTINGGILKIANDVPVVSKIHKETTEKNIKMEWNKKYNLIQRFAKWLFRI